MEDLDLNIDNYSLEDILNLFNINYDFDENDMKNAKKIVLKSHPDKSKLDKKYFLFFTKAYKYLYFIYDFRKKKYINKNNVTDSDKNNLNVNNLNLNNNINYELSDEEKEKNFNLLKNNKEITKNFNSWFNKMFEEHKISDENDEGYDEWLKDDNNFKTFENCNNISKMNETINSYKNNNFSLIKNEDFQDNLSSINYGSNLLNDKLDDYSSGDIFSKFGYNDLKKAHQESIIPVSEMNKKQDFKSVGDYEIFRKNQEINMQFYTMEESKKILENNKNNMDKIDNERAFRLAKHDEEVEKVNNIFWSKVKLLNQ